MKSKLKPESVDRNPQKYAGLIFAAMFILISTGCTRRQAMYHQPRYEPFEASDFFPDGRANRTPVPGTIARGFLKDDEHLWNGTIDGKPANIFPFAMTKDVIKRGQLKFQIHCTPCHSYTGDGWGMVVQRGLKRPPSFHEARLRQAPVSHFFNVITHGMGVMNSYAPFIRVEDRWAIIGYLRALQLSQNATLQDVPQSERVALEASK